MSNSLPLKLTVRYGRNVYEIELPPLESTLKGLQTKLELLTTVRPSLQRLIGPKGMLVSGHKVVKQKDSAEDDTNNNNNDETNSVSPRLEDIGMRQGMQILLVGAKSLDAETQNNNTHINTSSSENIATTTASTTTTTKTTFADIANLLVVSQPHPQEPETTLLKCSYSLGYINQAVYVCVTCIENGVAEESHAICASCADVCHEGHECVLWGVRRATRCDCCTSKCVPSKEKIQMMMMMTTQKQQQEQSDHGNSSPLSLVVAAMKARCMFLADERTHVAPSNPLPPNPDNVYPPFPKDWCACEMVPLSTSERDDANDDDDQNASDKTETSWGISSSIPCVGCGQCYWTRHLENLSCEALACQPCQGQQSGNAVAFWCRTCEGFSCIACRLHCHKNHDVDVTPYLFSPSVGGFVDPLRDEKVKKTINNNNNNNDDDDGGGEDSRGEDAAVGEDGGLQYFACCCRGSCGIVDHVAAQTFYHGAEIAKQIGNSIPDYNFKKRNFCNQNNNDDNNEDSEAVEQEDECSFIHPSATLEKTVPRDPMPKKNAALLIDDYTVFLCGPCSRKNLEIDEGILKCVLHPEKHEKKCYSTLKKDQQPPTLTDLIASTQEEQKLFNPSCLFRKNNITQNSAGDDDDDDVDVGCENNTASRNRNNNYNHGTLLPQIYFEWLRVTAKLVCGCRNCDLRFEKQLPLARRLDEDLTELSILVGGRCCFCTKLLETGGETYLCVTCERDAAATSSSSSMRNNTANDNNNSTSYELCESCYARRETLHPADHEFEHQTLGNVLRQVIALIDAEGDAATRIWLREQLIQQHQQSGNPVELLDSIFKLLTGHQRLEESEKSLRADDTLSVTGSSYSDSSDEENPEEYELNDHEKNNQNRKDGSTDCEDENNEDNNKNNNGFQMEPQSIDDDQEIVQFDSEMNADNNGTAANSAAKNGLNNRRRERSGKYVRDKEEGDDESDEDENSDEYDGGENTEKLIFEDDDDDDSDQEMEDEPQDGPGKPANDATTKFHNNNASNEDNAPPVLQNWEE